MGCFARIATTEAAHWNPRLVSSDGTGWLAASDFALAAGAGS